MSELSAWDESGMNHQGNPGGSKYLKLSILANTDKWARSRSRKIKLPVLDPFLRPVSLI